MLLANSSVIWDEYDAERNAAERIVTAYKSVYPGAKVKFNLILGFADDVVKKLQDFDVFIRGNIKRFRYWQIDATTITYSITTKIAGILILLAKVYALRRVSDDVCDVGIDVPPVLNVRDRKGIGHYRANGERKGKHYTKRSPQVSCLIDVFPVSNEPEVSRVHIQSQ
jgi:hypothetical protein